MIAILPFRELLVRRLDGQSATAVLDIDGSWTGSELLEHAGGMAQLLEQADLPPGAAVAAIISSSPRALALAVGGVLVGHPIAPLNVRSTPAELGTLVGDLGADVLIAELETAALALEVAQMREGMRVLTLPDRPQRVAGRWWAASHTVSVPGAILHTSGTTGRPKRVPLGQLELTERCTAYADAIEIGSGDTFYGPSPFHHTAGLGMSFVALGCGAAVLTTPWFTRDWWRFVRDVAPTHVLLVPTMIETLLGAKELDAGSGVLAYGGSPIHPTTVQRILDAAPATRVVQVFGQTEGSPLTVLSHEDHVAGLRGDPARLASVGRAARSVELRLEQTREDGIGEIVVRAPHLFRTDADGWLRTGDLGEVDADGYVYLRGRRGDMIIRGGENVYPLEVERIIESHPSVKEALVAGVPDRLLGEAVVAAIVAADSERPPDLVELRAFVRSRLAGFKVPEAWSVRTELPRNATGKLVRRAIAEEAD